MAKIREDLEGVVYVSGEDGAPVSLKAGDVIPKGATVGAHLTDEAAEADEPDAGRPKGNSSKEKWAAYAESLEITIEDDWKTADIKAAVEAHEAEADSGDDVDVDADAAQD